MSTFAAEVSDCREERLIPIPIKLHSSIKSTCPRGGSAIVQIDDGSVIAFGGVDREQCHFQDLIVYSIKTRNSVFEVVQTTGDVPTPRSGHSLVAYGTYVLLFGGLDFAEEAAYNDLYLLDTEFWEWSYVGESGIDVFARNSHSMAILQNPSENEKFLVLYGGASPDRGTLGDTVYASLPFDPSTVDPKTFFVEWRQLNNDSSPGNREMHSTSVVTCNHMIVAGGRRDNETPLLTDIWILSFVPRNSSLSITENDHSSPCPLTWTQLTTSLPYGICSHNSAVISVPIEVQEVNQLHYYYTVIGGFSGIGVSAEVHSTKITPFHCGNTKPDPYFISTKWQTHSMDSSLGRRFGQACCPLNLQFFSKFLENDRYRPILASQAITVDKTLRLLRSYPREEFTSIVAGLMIFGGVTVDQDFADIWLLIF